MKIDGDTVHPKELKETILDITKAYGSKTPPPLDSIPMHTIDFSKDYGITDLSADSIYSKMQSFEQNDFNDLLHYISDKLGYNHDDPAKYKQGLELAASWSLINKQHTRSDAFFCQETRSRTESKLQDCLSQRRMDRAQQVFEFDKQIQDHLGFDQQLQMLFDFDKDDKKDLMLY